MENSQPNPVDSVTSVQQNQFQFPHPVIHNSMDCGNQYATPNCPGNFPSSNYYMTPSNFGNNNAPSLTMMNTTPIMSAMPSINQMPSYESHPMSMLSSRANETLTPSLPTSSFYPIPPNSPENLTQTIVSKIDLQNSTSMHLNHPSQQSFVCCSDGQINLSELTKGNDPNETCDAEDNQIALSSDLIDVYNNLGIVGKILTGGSLVTIRFLRIFRELSESLVDALGIANPKYAAEIKAYEEMQKSEEEHHREIDRQYATWKPNESYQFQPPIINQNINQLMSGASDINPSDINILSPPNP
ncbi:hypothetical protein SSS_00496 [Sarcoptes scabiei]|uniref:Uncharacterized protein n=1 Tax=Sarcoptes scabiei TaxID=52283 RepID=A0A132AJG9_SARSC|nr:hypothetical protein SSS_00496 [Sarcoptes scabiei]KPM11126.1 hypothetical protein QR98_0096930 [Sarcoptes scabiei]